MCNRKATKHSPGNVGDMLNNLEIKSYLKNSFDFVEDGIEYDVEILEDSFILYHWDGEIFYPIKKATFDDLDGQDVEEYFREFLY